MKSLFCLLFAFIFSMVHLPAQPPRETKIDTAAVNKRKSEKIKAIYSVRQNYDSVKGVLPKKARVDTLSYSRYDANGRMIEFCISPGDKSEHHTWYFYDVNGKLVRRLSCNPDSSNGFHQKYEYDDSGRVVRIMTYSRTESKDEILGVSLYFYDESGLLASTETYRDSSNIRTRRYDKRNVHYYDAKKRETLMLTFSYEGDTIYIDSTIYTSGNNYVQRGYAIEPMLIGDKIFNQRRLISRSGHKSDTVGDRIITEHDFLYYSGRDHINEIRSWDSTITDINGNVLFTYMKDQSTEYFYSKGKFDYSIEYNRKHQPVFRQRKWIVYYK